MESVAAILYLFAAYILFCKLWPYFLYPNYFLKSKVERYPELVELSSKLRGENPLQTAENAYAYMQRTYTGYTDAFKIRSLLTIFQFRDFSTKNLLNKKQFLWCHTQNRLLKSILVNTGHFKESDVVIKRRLFFIFFIHQWVSLRVDGKEIKIDPHCAIFETR
ncbi:hypothetical protein A3D71_02135 [Candidatus Kaiserbacteria bacterium RIFCSPHIGHO2_02_FULL_55_20]|uniref:Uncharacterized protein n=1 Tax=Candidatus Kaiserbacteria bacterium RIFCSPHIGHO2_02_FULL_55_20 TaxID=1798497 RepID=A0A1F6DX44_9BACT|nr:MAG: hypothetical protein A2680_02995 [Candidatus Kaiserbacteria bacterium RIFCSPHIGHO2_01_FULL_55_37]OGG65995.1 MAG: hypothetical protein A3D71_02135 [Candidatus Kaiserbacteria bacterium RIFCSPHIGHO2_02_FULL_55_20]